jgi:hypothetical protein
MRYDIRATPYDIRNTTYEIRAIMQNKPNFRKAQMNVTAVNTRNNELRTMNYFVQNKPNQTQSQTLHTLAHFLPIFSYLSHPNPTSQPTRPHFCAKNDDLPSKTQNIIEESVHLIQNSPVKTHPFGHTPSWSSFNYCQFLGILPYYQAEGKINLLEIEFFKLIIAKCISSKIMERDGTKTNVITVENKMP